MTFIRTVLGDILPDDLGVCLSHDHLLGRPPNPEDDQILDSLQAALAELRRYSVAGGRSMVEMTTIDYGQDAAGLRALALESGMHIVAVTGFNKEKYSAPFLEADIDALAQRFIQAVEAGITGSNGVRAGVIKVATMQNEISAKTEKMFHAAALAHKATGAPISTHCEAGTMALEQIDLLTTGGVDPAHIVIGHLDRKLEWDYHLQIARRGVFMGFDQIAKQRYAPDSRRVEFIARLCEAGHGSQILLSQDQARRSYWPSYGNPEAPGLAYLLEKFVPLLREAGFSPPEIDGFLIDNPSRAFSFTQ